MPGSPSWMPYAPQGVNRLDDDDDDKQRHNSSEASETITSNTLRLGVNKATY
jgi:hypothetical protein